jgi:riboflavin kinase/FMN adenylyltransferase
VTGVQTCALPIFDGASLPGVASIGVNPTVGALSTPLLETHIFDFDADLYGKTIEVEIIDFLRDEAHFADIEALKLQMADDAARARVILA